MADASKIDFTSFHLPPMAPGRYSARLDQRVRSKTSAKISSQSHSKSVSFVVAGERFTALAPTDVHAIFPPQGNLGQHSNMLPHITLKRSTFPWERTPLAAEGDTAPAQRQKVPWLLLLLFRESEKPTPKVMTLKELKEGTDVPYPAFDYEPGDQKTDEVTVIDVAATLLTKIMPKAEDLKYLAHVREPKTADGESAGDVMATILCNRLPRPKEMSTVHLVAVEERYSSTGFDTATQSTSGMVRLVSLKSWSFACVARRQVLTKLLENLDRATGVNLPATGNAAADAYVSKGHKPLAHALRGGQKTVSWYHGPLTTGQNPARLTQPVMSADELLRFDASTGMFDVSYAAAWQLGRLLTLRNKRASIAIYNWKRDHAQWLRRLEQIALHLSYLGGQSAQNEGIPDPVAEWFSDLEILKGIPFNYLLPDEAMLPVESIRFFQVDSYWVDCLQDGAFSIGRVTDTNHDDDRRNASLATRTDVLSGFLMRSEIVAGWPDLVVRGFGEVEEGGEKVPASEPLPLVRMDRLSPNILICLFQGDPLTIAFSLKPEGLNFGLDPAPTGQPRPTTKGLRNLQGTDTAVEVDDIPWRHAEDRVLNVSTLATRIRTELSLSESAFSSAQFALQMIEGTPRVEFSKIGRQDPEPDP